MEPDEITPNDTVCAVSTPAGVGGIAVVRVSGPRAFDIVGRIWRGRPLDAMPSHTAHLGEILDSVGATLDQCVLTIFRAPRSFTSEDVAEISVHGSRYIQRELIASLIAAGARLAQPGEFTRRAFASGRMDLAEAEAVADIIASESRAAHRIAVNQMKGGFSRRLAQLRQNLLELVALMELELDFSEEDVEFASRAKLLEIASGIQAEVDRLHRSFATGAAIKNGIPVAIVGDTNAGKSSLLNLILGDDRAIVSEIRGTTRDTIEETVTVGDYLFRFIDTAGIRDNTDDEIERLGIRRSLDAMKRARIVLIVTDVTQPFNPSLLASVAPGATPILLANKTDLLPSAPEATTAHSADAASSPLAKAATAALPTDSAAPPEAIASCQPAAIASDLPEGVAVIPISAKTGEGLDRLKAVLTETVARDTAGDDILVVNARHAEALAAASRSNARTIEGLRANLPGDLVSQDIRETLHHLAAITGDIPSTEILSTIFSRFCVGK